VALQVAQVVGENAMCHERAGVPLQPEAGKGHFDRRRRLRGRKRKDEANHDSCELLQLTDIRCRP